MVLLIRKMCIAALLLCVTAVSATAQTITAKCKTCGKPIAACPYKGRHPAAAPGKKPARQQPSRRHGGHSGAMRPTQSQGVSGSSSRPQTTRPVVNPEKANLLNLIAKPFGVVENVSENTTPQQIRTAVSQKLGQDVMQLDGMMYLYRDINHNLCGVPVDHESVFFYEGKLSNYSYRATFMRVDKSQEEVTKIVTHIANLLGLVIKESGGTLQSSSDLFYAEIVGDKRVILTIRIASQYEIQDCYRITLEVRL